jgi:peptidylprolyl isomerase/peptidyl-prolyl cis-trans isomerase D
MVEAFEEAAFNAEPGALVGPVKSNFGYHLIRVEQKADRAVQFADLAYDLRPSQATLTDKENTLEDLVYFADEGEGFQAEAERMGLNLQTVEVEAEQSSIPGIGQSAKLTRFLETAEEGDISEIAELNDRFAVARVTGVEPEGYRPFDEVRSQIRPRVEVEKKKEVLSSRMRRALRQNGFDGMAGVLNTRIRTKDDVTYTTTSVPGLGREPAFVGTVFGLDDGETSGIVEGENAAFVVQVSSMNRPNELTAQQRQQIRQQLLRQEQRSVAQQYIATLRDRAEIEDYRSEFQ